MRRLAPALVVLSCWLDMPAWRPAQDLRPVAWSTKTLVANLARYVREYERTFAFLIADESYEQVSSGFGADPARSRVMRGEMFLTFVPADNEWIAVHDVAVVDGEPVADREDLRLLLQRRESLRGVAAKIAERNARFNIGSVTRNFNEPTLALLLLGDKRIDSVKFDQLRLEYGPEATLATLKFVERGQSTLVRGSSGPAPASGLFVIEADTGRVRRTVFTLQDRSTTVTLETTYARDDKLDLWVPTRFTERYESRIGPLSDTVQCEAAYSNYRRFEVAVRIK